MIYFADRAAPETDFASPFVAEMPTWEAPSRGAILDLNSGLHVHDDLDWLS